LRDPFYSITKSIADLPHYRDLVQRRMEGNQAAANPYCAFDVVIIQRIWADAHPDTLAPDWMTFVEANRTTALYRVVTPRSCLPPLLGVWADLR
jgi:hypothetical protein